MTGEPAHLARTRAAYDQVAEDYAALLRDALAGSPYDRAVLGLFADLVPDRGPVADLGCGPGRVTEYLAGQGLDVFGMDLSPGMVEVARRTYPGLRFDVGSLLALDLPDGQLAGAVAWYSIIHTPPADLPRLFAELSRVLAPGGVLLLAFQVGDQRLHLTQAYGHDLSLEVHRLLPASVSGLLADHDLVLQAELVRRPAGRETTEQAYLLARRA